MAGLADALKSEIERVAEKQVKGQLKDLSSTVKDQEREIKNLQRQVSQLEKELAKGGSRRAAKAPSRSSAVIPGRRFSPKGLASHRDKLGLSAADYGKLVGVSALSIYNWEQGKTRPRAAQLEKLIAVRDYGKKEAYAALGYEME